MIQPQAVVWLELGRHLGRLLRGDDDWDCRVVPKRVLLMVSHLILLTAFKAQRLLLVLGFKHMVEAVSPDSVDVYFLLVQEFALSET